MDGLLDALKSAPSEEVAASLETRIRQKWIEAGSPAATLLMRKGLRNLQGQAGEDALGDFDAALVLEPNLQAALTFRARAKYLTGDYVGALKDTQEALEREPRNFVALQGLSQIAEQRGDLKGALQAWQKLLEIDPRTPDAEKRLRELNRKVNGETT
jgi:tetratricopeptide (TPR) repeat protein